MAGLPAINVSGDDRNELLLTKPDSATQSSASYRPSSVKPSMRSSSSRITLIGYDAELETKQDSTYNTTHNENGFSWFDHLLAVFCIHRRREKRETPPQYQPTVPADHEVKLDSPWVLPVYVLSAERDESRHLIPKEAKCTIDTGNLQGNIVSRAFVVDILGFSESSFHQLTKVEEEGGTGVTGHKLIPGGAIYLTWYHNNSTRVFRDMRFLISDHPAYDIIIGARSIQKNGILDVPNLASVGAVLHNKPKGLNSPELGRIEKDMRTGNIRLTKIQLEIEEAKKDPKRKEQLQEEQKKLKDRKQTLNKERDHEVILLVKNGKGTVEGKSLEELLEDFKLAYKHPWEEKKAQ